MSTAVEAKPKNADDKKEDVFVAWQKRKESFNSPTDKEGGLKPPANTGRRRSVLKDLASNMKGLRRMTLTVRAKSDISAEMVKPVKKENTYKMKPDTNFSVSKVSRAVTKLLSDELEDLVYDHDISSKLSVELAEKVKDKVKELNFPRYKIAVNVFVGQAAEQGMEAVSRCCWDQTTDNSVCITHQNKDLFVTALVFGIYFE